MIPTPPPNYEILTDYTTLLPKGAMCFWDNEDRWTESGRVGQLPSQAFTYAVPTDSAPISETETREEVEPCPLTTNSAQSAEAITAQERLVSQTGSNAPVDVQSVDQGQATDSAAATGEPEHNPDGLTPEQYGAPEWRLLRVGELVEKADEYWETMDALWLEAAWRDLPENCTYRRRVTRTPDAPKAETPRTDALVSQFGNIHLADPFHYALIDHSKTLERETITLRAELLEWQTIGADAKTQQEVVALRAELEAKAREIEILTGTNEFHMRELSEAVESGDKLAAQLAEAERKREELDSRVTELEQACARHISEAGESDVRANSAEARVAELEKRPRVEQCLECNTYVSDWVEDDQRNGRICRPCETIRHLRARATEAERQLGVALKGKRPFSSEFAEQVIANQVKRITELEELLSKATAANPQT